MEPAEEISYEDAAKELEQILDALEGDDVSVDSLAVKVERAAVLLKICSERLRDTEAKVTDIVNKLNL